MPADVNTGRLRADKNKVVTSIALYTSSSLRLVKWTVFFQLEVHPSAAVILDLRVMATNSEPQETPEYRTFRQYYDRLYNAIQDPLSLATRLFASNIVTSAVREEMSAMGRTRLDRNNALLGAVETRIQTDPSRLQEFLSHLNEDPSMQSLVENIRGKNCCVT